MIGPKKPKLEELKHYGVKGMKWGVRSGGLGDRVKGAIDDKNQRRTAFLTRARDKRGADTEERVSRRVADAVNLGSKRTNKNIDRQLNGLRDQRKRIDAGKLKAQDYLEFIGTVPVGDLIVSRRDNKG